MYLTITNNKLVDKKSVVDEVLNSELFFDPYATLCAGRMGDLWQMRGAVIGYKDTTYFADNGYQLAGVRLPVDSSYNQDLYNDNVIVLNKSNLSRRRDSDTLLQKAKIPSISISETIEQKPVVRRAGKGTELR